MELVCVAENFFQAQFSQSLIFAWRGHFQELQLNNDLVDFSKIWPDARKIYNQQKRFGEFDNSKNSVLESHFRAFTPHVFLAVLKMFSITFESNRIWENPDTFFKLLGS